MKHSVKMSLDLSGDCDTKFYHAYEEGNPDYILDLCDEFINKLWPKTKDVTDIVVRVAEHKFEGSRKINVRIVDVGDSIVTLRWSTLRMKEQNIDCLAANWILERFPSFADKETHSIYVSVTPE